jgi:hypothetical protein
MWMLKKNVGSKEEGWSEVDNLLRHRIPLSDDIVNN